MHANQPTDMLLRFGAFEADVQTGELRKQGKRVRLQDQPFQLLIMLLEAPGQVVTRDELRSRLWPQTTVDFDHGLNKAVSKIRDVLGDSAENPRFIETVARRGYRFLADVAVVRGVLSETVSSALVAVAQPETVAGDPGLRADPGVLRAIDAGRAPRRPPRAFPKKLLGSGLALVLATILVWILQPWRHAEATMR